LATVQGRSFSRKMAPNFPTEAWPHRNVDSIWDPGPCFFFFCPAQPQTGSRIRRIATRPLACPGRAIVRDLNYLIGENGRRAEGTSHNLRRRWRPNPNCKIIGVSACFWPPIFCSRMPAPYYYRHRKKNLSGGKIGPKRPRARRLFTEPPPPPRVLKVKRGRRLSSLFVEAVKFLGRRSTFYATFQAILPGRSLLR